MRLNPIAKAVLLSVLATSAGSAVAQQQEQSSQAKSNELKIERIQVTARKIKESSQEVPVSMSVITSDALDNIAAFDFKDITKLAPGLEISGDDAISGTIKMRGVGKDAFTGLMDDSVVVFIDGVAQTSVGAAFGSLSDIARVEVLRGPQGTLYGKNAPAGAINITTKSIDMDNLSGGFKTSHVFFDETSTYGTSNKAHINIPLNDEGTLGMRLSGFYDDSDGYVENALLNKPANDSNRQGARLKVQYIPNDDTDITFIGNYSDSYNGRVFSYIPGFGADFISKKDAASTGTPNSQDTFESVLGSNIAIGKSDDYKIYVDQNAFSKTLLKDAQININYDSENHSFVSISYYQDVKSQFVTDQNGTPIFDGLLDINTEQSLVSQEVRVSNIENDVLGYMFGFYYSKSKTSGPGGQTSSLIMNGTSFKQQVAPGFFVDIFQDLETKVFGKGESESFGYFAHLDYHIDDEWTVSGGLRYNDETKTYGSNLSVTGTNYVFGQVIPFTFDSDAFPTDSDSYYNLSGSIKLQYQQDEDVMYYLALDSAYRSGGFNLNAVAPLEELRTFAPEDSYSFEIGMKGSFLDDRLQFNIDYYYQIFENYQFGDLIRQDNYGDRKFSDIGSDLAVDGLTLAQSHVLNAKEAVTTGIETDFIYLASANFTVSGGLTYIDATYKDFIGFCDDGQGPTSQLYCDFSGQTIGSNFGIAPASWVANIHPLYFTEVADWGVKLSVSTQINYDDVRDFNLDYHVGFEPLDGDWSLKFFIKNGLNRKPGDVYKRAVGGSNDTYAYDLIAPRQIGLTFGYDF